ncbi:hypothetical protein OPV22_008754 [Ensete ventricosum]|uniref:Uncharacterized protein n=1 Tax=Ensete ventricosum TaxID=4639 RepID=A0AAV8RBU3_ENSVE|nr:hypothetical protein OPV22_008754 [Ensete ventricosum]
MEESSGPTVGPEIHRHDKLQRLWRWADETGIWLDSFTLLREERSKQVPKVQMINEILDYIKGLGPNDEDLHKLQKKFPDVLGCSLVDEVLTSIDMLKKDWGIQGRTLRNLLLLRNPKVLGYNVDSFRTPSQGMLGRSSAVTLPTREYSASYSLLLDTSIPIPNLVLPICKSSCGVRPVVRMSANQNKSCNSKKWRIHSVEQVQAVLSEDEQKKTWETCIEILSTLNFSIEEADSILKKAFGWVHSPYWGEERSKEVPKVQKINEMLDYIKGLGLNDEDLYKLLKKFPEVLGCSLVNEVQTNIGMLEKDWGIKGKALRNLLIRNPKVLGYNVDCKGDCMAQCTRCWVRF